ncbi:MAG: hypothetical protein COC06_09660 [Bacteroidales bacterium]|nr:MAG: hypothetical protein COC06_09660 [Bacteroidales bacterium]
MQFYGLYEITIGIRHWKRTNGSYKLAIGVILLRNTDAEDMGDGVLFFFTKGRKLQCVGTVYRFNKLID